MESTKTKFQADLSKMETLLWQLKYSYPLNFGMSFRLNMSYFLMLLAVCMLADEYCCGDLYTRTSFVALVLLVYGIVQWNRDAGSDMTDASGDYKYFSKQLSEAMQRRVSDFRMSRRDLAVRTAESMARIDREIAESERKIQEFR